MSDLNNRDAKIVQYLLEAHGKEKELETSLEAHIAETTKMPYKKRLRKHLTETRDHARQIERRLKQLDGQDDLNSATHTVQAAVKKGVALAKGPAHALRGASTQETMLKNAKTEYFNEAEEIATYTAIEALAEKAGDVETAKLARSIRRDEERMAKFLDAQIITLARAVATEEIPASERRTSGRRAPSRARASAAV
jgi:ferritin-like metal-binding protein YciE